MTHQHVAADAVRAEGPPSCSESTHHFAATTPGAICLCGQRRLSLTPHLAEPPPPRQWLASRKAWIRRARTYTQVSKAINDRVAR